jgi:hypothetical protein
MSQRGLAPSGARETGASMELLALAAADDAVGIAWRPDAGGTRVLLLAAH